MGDRAFVTLFTLARRTKGIEEIVPGSGVIPAA